MMSTLLDIKFLNFFLKIKQKFDSFTVELECIIAQVKKAQIMSNKHIFMT